MNKTTKENRGFQTSMVRLSRAFAVAGFLFCAGGGFAQTAVVSGFSGEAVPVQAISETPPAQPDSVVAVTADAYSLSPTPLESLPVMGGTFYIVENNGVIPPFPCLPVQYWTCPAWAITDGIYLVDATGGQVPEVPRRLARQSMTATAVDSVQAAIDAQGNAVANLIEQVQDAQMMRETAAMFGLDMPMLDSGSEYSANFAYSFDTNALWLEITNVSNGYSYYNLHNATNLVYAILTTTNLLTSFAVETELWPTDPNCQPLNLQNNSRQYLFVRAMDWTGVDSDSDGVTDWWSWKYFGNINLTDTNLDYSGNGLTFAQDYSNNITPTVYTYTGLEVPNNYVSTTTPAVQLDVEGSPYYVAVAVDDPNYMTDAVWNTYSGSTVPVNLGIAQGWHEVRIGLRGHADDPTSAVWQRKRLKLDWTPPALFITSPTNNTVDIPTIQLQGFSPEALSSISYDLSNAAGTLTNQQVLVLDQYYDTNTLEFTTNTFQAFDVSLATGANIFTLHATDLAGNVTTTSFAFTLDFSSKTNPPVAALIWPQNGIKVCGSNFTCNGSVSDPTASVTIQTVDTNGNTNVFNALVGRDGGFYVSDLPLNSGTNVYTLTVTDVASNMTTTNFTVIQGDAGLTIDPISPNQTTVTGEINFNTFTVWVNGIKATMSSSQNGNGVYTWEADDVPIPPNGSVVQVTAIPNSDNGGYGSWGNGGGQ
jgi:hypothetical protein